jgi:LuxR family maltose regulon positive regulatory protein
LIEQARVRLWIAQGDWTRVKEWSDAQPVNLREPPEENPVNEYEETRLITLCRAWIALGRYEKDPQRLRQAVLVLKGLAISAQASLRMHASIEISLLGTLAFWELAQQGLGGSVEALDWLTRSLADGLPNGYRRVYINEGRPVLELLHAWLEKDRRWIEASSVSPSSVRVLLEAIDAPVERQPEGLAEPLTEREKDVLHLLSLGLSNREMAQNMVVSEGTIKTHVHNLIGKLGVQSRMQALARAKELKLLP